MKRILNFSTLAIIFTFAINISFGQVISQFDFENNPVTQATIGPDATTTSSSVISDANGSTGNGLNPSTPKGDIEFTIPGSPTFDVTSIEIQFDYQREESQAFFFERGANMKIQMQNGNISVEYMVNDGNGSFTQVISGNIYAVPYDDTYRTYKFKYDESNGEGTFEVDGIQVWINDGEDNRNLYWDGAGDVMIGRLLDGSGTNKTCLDNYIVSVPAAAVLPVELAYFDVIKRNDDANIVWETASETMNNFFTIERSVNGRDWQEVNKVNGAGNSDNINTYSIMDENPFNGLSYYRLKQTDFDGTFTYSEIRSIKFDNGTQVEIYPNPVVNELKVRGEDLDGYQVSVFNQAGQIMPVQINNSGEIINVNMSDLNQGVYVLTIIDPQHQVSTQKIIKE